MRRLFDDHSFAFETLRTLGFATAGGADFGDVFVTARAIPDGDETAWRREWRRTAERVERIAEASIRNGHAMRARGAFLRASNYYRAAEYYRRDDPARDPEAAYLSARSCANFARAAALLGTPVQPVAIPYERATLAGYFFGVDDSTQARATIVFIGGCDSTLEEAYFAIAAAAMLRGYNVLAFDGPGQGSSLRDQRLYFRHDWEEVIRPVIDVAVTIPEIAPERIALVGYGLGGYLAARAAAFEHRIAALVLQSSVFDYHHVNLRALPQLLADWVIEGRDQVALPGAELLMNHDTSVRRALRNGRWTFGATSVPDYLRRTRQYTLEGVTDRVACSTLVLDTERNHLFRGEAQRVVAGLACPKTLVTLTEAEGAGEHMDASAQARAHQVTFDWLDETLHDRSNVSAGTQRQAVDGVLMRLP